MNSIYVSVGGRSSDYGIISHSSLNSHTDCQQSLDAWLGTNATSDWRGAQDRLNVLSPTLSRIDSSSICYLADILALLDAGGDCPNSSNYCKYYQSMERRPLACSEVRARQIWSKLELNEELEFEKDTGYQGRYEKWLLKKIRSDKCRTRRWHTDVPHFEYDIAYPAQQPLRNRSTINNIFGEHRDNVYYETLSLPEVYPQEDLCDESDAVEEGIVGAPQDDSRTLLAENIPPDSGNLSGCISDNEVRPRVSIKEAHAMAQRSSFTQTQADATDAGNLVVDDTIGAIKSVQQEPILSIELTKSMVQNQTLDDARQAFFSRVPHAQAFGQVKTIDLPITETEDIVHWFMNDVDSTRRCALCVMVSFGLISVESIDEEGRSSQPIQGPTIITDSYAEEVVSLLPSFNRMMLNRQEGSCSQCSLVMEVLFSVHGLAIFDEHSFFDREALISCYFSPPVGSVEAVRESAVRGNP
jgi:hypothetical protein